MFSLFDWRFWLIVIIIIFIIKWLYNSYKVSPPPYEDPENERCKNDPELCEIAISWIPSPVVHPIIGEISSSSERLPPYEPPIVARVSPSSSPLIIREPPEEEVLEDDYQVDLLNNGNSSVGEHLTAQAFRVIIGDKEIIRNIRPKFLKNPKTGYPMEIDCYCPELKIGVEYNGIGHYQWPNPFHSTEEEFDDQVQRDLDKRRLANENGVTIFTVPCTVDGVRYNPAKKKYMPVRRTRQQRYDLIYAYLKEKMSIIGY